MDLFKQRKKLEEKIESFFDPASEAAAPVEPDDPTPPPPLPAFQGLPGQPNVAEGSGQASAPPGEPVPGALPAGPVRPFPQRPHIQGQATDATLEPTPLAGPRARSAPAPQGPAGASVTAAQVPPAQAAPAQAAPAQAAPPAVSGNFSSPLKLREPLELKKAVVRAVEAEIIRVDGQPTFPFNRIDVELIFVDDRHKVRLQAELEDGERLETDIRRALQAGRVIPDARLSVWLHFISPEKVKNTQTLRQGYMLEFTREVETERIKRPEAQRGRLTVEQGQATPPSLPIQKARINLGRMTEVRDQQGRVVRRNDMVFADEGEINTSVSRLHAHIEFDTASDEYRLYDDNSAEGTVVFREGRRIVVPQGNRRGVSLASGDEIYLGRARVKFER